MNIICTKSKCLNNKGGKCIANEIYYEDYVKHIALANTPASSMREYANDHMAE